MPLVVGRRKLETFSFVREKVWSRLGTWRSKKLSKAGKEILLKTAARALPTYVISLYELPNTLCDQIHKLMNGYWWSGNTNGGGLCWMSWDRLCVHKLEGGIGFRDLKQFNLALLAKQGWRIMNSPDCLMTRVMRAKCFRDSSFLSAVPCENASMIWRSFMAARDILLKGCRVRIGDGDLVSVWGSPWLPCPSNGCVTTLKRPELSSLMVSDLFVPGCKIWDVEKVNAIFNERDCDLILSIPLTDRRMEDNWWWIGNKEGSYTVKSGYRMVRLMNGVEEGSESTNQVWSKLWKANAMPKMLNLLWRASTNWLPTKSKLLQRSVVDSTICPVCERMKKTALHILVTCDFAKSV